MWKPTRAEGAVLAGTVFVAGLGTIYGLHEKNNGPEGQGGDKPTEAKESAEATAARLEWEKRMDEARQGRIALAKRYAGCTVVKVEDTHTSEKRTGDIATDDRGLPEPYQNVTRNKVVVTVQAELTPESVEAEAKYANGQPRAKDVTWLPFGAAGDASILREDPKNPDRQTRAMPIPDHSTSKKTGPATETFTITMYPRTDGERRTTSAEISLGTSVETHDKEGNNGNGTTYRAAGRISCGVVYEDVDISDPTKLEPGPLTWQVSQSKAEGIEAFEYAEEACVLVPTGQNTVEEQCN